MQTTNASQKIPNAINTTCHVFNGGMSFMMMMLSRDYRRNNQSCRLR
jgi:hypothetical protein